MGRHLDTEQRFELVLRHLGRVFGNAHRALALHVGMAAYRADPGADLADVAAQQQQVDQHLHVLYAVAVLGHAHAVDDHHLVAARIDRGGGFQCATVEAGAPLQLRPVVAVGFSDQAVEAFGVLRDECMVEHRRAALGSRIAVHRQQSFDDAHDRRGIAADLHLMVLGADDGRIRTEHLGRGLRIDEALQAALAYRVEGDDRHLALACFLQRMEHARAVAADVLTEEKNAVGVLEVRQRHRAHRHPDALLQAH